MIELPDADVRDEALREAVLTALGTVYDPELGLDVVSLGLVYDVRVGDGRVEVDMTLTTPGCPVSESLPREAQAAVERAVAEADRVDAVLVQVVWDPPWTPDRVSPVALQHLGIRRR